MVLLPPVLGQVLSQTFLAASSQVLVLDASLLLAICPASPTPPPPPPAPLHQQRHLVAPGNRRRHPSLPALQQPSNRFRTAACIVRPNSIVNENESEPPSPTQKVCCTCAAHHSGAPELFEPFDVHAVDSAAANMHHHHRLHTSNCPHQRTGSVSALLCARALCGCRRARTSGGKGRRP